MQSQENLQNSRSYPKQQARRNSQKKIERKTFLLTAPFFFQTGNVFEKHLLDTYLSEHQTDPITNEPAAAEDYVELKGLEIPSFHPPSQLGNLTVLQFLRLPVHDRRI